MVMVLLGVSAGVPAHGIPWIETNGWLVFISGYYKSVLGVLLMGTNQRVMHGMQYLLIYRLQPRHRTVLPLSFLWH
jgi:hypothetical protein